MTRFSFRSLTALAVFAIMLAGCGDDNEQSAGAAGKSAAIGSAGDGPRSPLVDYIPADTPYLLANRDRLSDSVMDLIWESVEPALKYGQSQINVALDDEKMTSNPLAKAILDELNGNMSRAGMATLGLEPLGNIAVYGVGVLPVVRAQIAQPDVLRATIDRIETNSGMTFERGTVDGIEYYQGGDKDAIAIVAIDGNQLVIGLVPIAAKEAALSQMLVEKPASNALARIDSLNKTYGLLPYGTFSVNTAALIDAVFTDPSESAQALFAEPRAMIDAQCVAEFREMAGVAPELVSGYTSIEHTKIDSVTVMKLRDDIAQSLQGLAVAMPGIDQIEDSMVYFAMAFDLLKTKQFLLDQSAKISAEPYACEQLADLNQGMTQMQQQLGQPLPPMVGNIQGLRMSLKNIDMSAGMPQDIRALAMIGITNPQLIVGMAGAMVPQLANLQLSNDGTPQPVPADLIPFPLDQPHVAMMNHGLGFSIGAGEQERLTAFLDAKPPKSGAPIMAIGYDMEAMRMYQQQMMQAMAAMSDGEVPEIPMSERTDRVTGLLSFTSRGLEVVSTAYLNP